MPYLLTAQAIRFNARHSLLLVNDGDATYYNLVTYHSMKEKTTPRTILKSIASASISVVVDGWVEAVTLNFVCM
eukprot:scaffold9681_cov103-Skeletonema_dohrnii-CCMP3373.AAC.11